MDKIKAVFSPGSSKDDEIMYGDPEARRKESLANNTTTTQDEAQNLYPVEGAPKSGGILSQITNPDGAKYDPRAFETTATTAEPSPHKLQTDPTTKEHTILGQILNPGGKKYDEQRFGETATATSAVSGLGASEAAVIDPNTKLETTESGQNDHTILRQLLNPSGKKADDLSVGTTAHASGEGQSTTLTDRSVAPTSAETGVTGGTTGVTSGYSGSGIAGSTVPKYNEPQKDVLDRSHPLRAGAGAEHINPIGSPETHIEEHSSNSQSLSTPAGQTTAPGGATSHIRPTTNAALLGTGAAAGGGLAASSSTHGEAASANQPVSTLGTSGAAHHPEGTKLNCDGNPTHGYVHHVSGPHSTDTANLLDPALAGTQTSADRGAVGGTGAGLAATSQTTSTSGNPMDNTPSQGTTVAGTSIPSQSQSAGYNTAGVSQTLKQPVGKEQVTSHDKHDHEKKEKTGLLQKILHPGGHKEEKNTGSSHEHSHPSTAVNDHGRNVLHKDPPASHPAAQPAADAVNKSGQ